jgi:hypothetical protein
MDLAAVAVSSPFASQPSLVALKRTPQPARRLNPNIRLVVIAVALLGTAGAVAQDKPPIVAAASDLKFILTATAARFEADTHRKVTLNFGSSGNFARQIHQGAPFELFMSANEGFVFLLAGAPRASSRSPSPCHCHTRHNGRSHPLSRSVRNVCVEPRLLAPVASGPGSLLRYQGTKNDGERNSTGDRPGNGAT